MELDAGERAVLDCGDDRAAVVDPRNNELVVVGLHGVAVSEVHVGAVETVEDAGRPRARELVPAHVRHRAGSQPANSAAVARPELIDELADRLGAQCVVLAIDAKRGADAWEVFVAGGRTATGRDAVAWAREGTERGAGEILLTSMDRDGTNDGYDLALTRAVAGAVPVPVIASGGAGTLDHLAQALRAGADAALCASIFHYGQHTVAEAKAHLAAAGIAVRA